MEKLKRVIAKEIVARLNNYNISINDIRIKSDYQIGKSCLYNYKKGLYSPSNKNSILILNIMKENYPNTLKDMIMQIRTENIINDDDLKQMNNFIGDTKNNG